MNLSGKTAGSYYATSTNHSQTIKKLSALQKEALIFFLMDDKALFQ